MPASWRRPSGNGNHNHNRNNKRKAKETELTIAILPLNQSRRFCLIVHLKRSNQYPSARPKPSLQPCCMPKPKTCLKTWVSFFQRHLLFVRQNRPLRRLRWLLKGFDLRAYCLSRKSCKPFRPALPCAHAFRGFCRHGHKNNAASVGAGPYTLARSIGCKRAIRVFSAGRQNRLASTRLYISCWTSAAA